jgi:hypothetical protein
MPTGKTLCDDCLQANRTAKTKPRVYAPPVDTGVQCRRLVLGLTVFGVVVAAVCLADAFIRGGNVARLLREDTEEAQLAALINLQHIGYDLFVGFGTLLFMLSLGMILTFLSQMADEKRSGSASVP